MVTVRPLLSEVSEEALLDQILPFFTDQPGSIAGPGDDAAVLATGESVVATTDIMVRGRDWLDTWSSPGDVATKLLAQNLADIAAMGAVPTSVLVTLAADPATPVAWALEFARALGAGAAQGGVAVAGGDLSSAPAGVVMVSLVALGDLRGRSPVMRSGARPGDVLAVSGSLGWSAAGLELLHRGADPHESGRGLRTDCLNHHLRPSVDLAAGPQAADAGATSMLDISDGLLRDGARVARASGVRLALDADLLEPRVRALADVVGAAARECVLAGGEEHSLLATFPSEVPDGWYEIGRVEEGDGVTLGGEPQTPRGWDHFAQVPGPAPG